MRSGSLALLLIGACAAGACTDFQNPTTVVDLRMLAVKTDPSEIILSADLSNPLMPIVDPHARTTSRFTRPFARSVVMQVMISSICPGSAFAPSDRQ